MSNPELKILILLMAVISGCVSTSEQSNPEPTAKPITYTGNAATGKTASDEDLVVTVVNLRYTDEFKGREGTYRAAPENRFAILYVESQGKRVPSFELVDLKGKTYQLDPISKKEYFLIFEIPKTAVGNLKLRVILDNRQWAIFDLSDY